MKLCSSQLFHLNSFRASNKFFKIKKKFFAECQVRGTRQRNSFFFKKNLCRVPDQGALGKEIQKIKKFLCRVPDQGALGKEIRKIKKFLCRVPDHGALGKEIQKIKKIFAECQIRGTRQRFKFKFCKRLRMKKLSTSKF